MTDLSAIISEVNKKQDVLTDNAIRAKGQYDQVKDHLFKKHAAMAADDSSAPVIDELESNYTAYDVQEIKTQIATLKGILKASHFDEIVFLLSNPGQLIGMNFLIGLVRGIGFSIGFLAIFLIFLYAIVSAISPSLLRLILP